MTRLANIPQRTLPSNDAILAIPRAIAGEFELNHKEAQTLRSRIYSINKNNAAGWRFRTMRDGAYLLVWRIA